jgi:hypothetical protein
MEPGDMNADVRLVDLMIHIVENFTKDRRLWAGPYLFPGTSRWPRA